MTTHLIKHALRISAGAADAYSPEGWNPKLRVTVMGPTPPDAELVWTQYRADGSEWFSHSTSVPELEDEQMHQTSMQRWESGTDIDEDGTFRFTVRLVNELDGIDELLHDGTFAVTRVDDEKKKFAVDHSALLTTGLVALDTYDQNDAPKVRATVILGGSVDTYEVEAHLFHDGKRFAKASYVESGSDLTANDGTTLAREFIAEFDDVRGWNNLSAEGWGGDWHLLDAAPGAYEIKFTRGGKVNRTMAFEVADGRIVKDDLIEPDYAGRPTLWRRAEIVGAFEGDAVAVADAPRAYGDLETAAIDYSSDGMYWERKEAEVAEESPYDEETAELVQGVVDTTTRLLHSWEAELAAGIVRDDYDTRQFALQCEYSIIDEVDRYEPRFAALGGVADEHAVTLVDGSETTLADAAARVIAMRAKAKAFLVRLSGDQEAVLEPYRAVLRNAKLRIFEDHPAPDFLYYTTNKYVIETPDELAAAAEWYFEGVNDIEATATVDGQKVSGSVAGWRVLGYRFDDDHEIVEETEQQGTSSTAPKTAFRIS